MIYFFMEDMYMNEFNTIDKVKSLFESFGMNGNQNSYFNYVIKKRHLIYHFAVVFYYSASAKVFLHFVGAAVQ